MVVAAQEKMAPRLASTLPGGCPGQCYTERVGRDPAPGDHEPKSNKSDATAGYGEYLIAA